MITAAHVASTESYQMWSDAKGINIYFEDGPHECLRCGKMTIFFVQPWHQASGCQFCAGSNHE